MNILSYIPTGQKHAVSCTYLASITGMSPRGVRHAIKALVRAGIPVVSSSSSKGYWMAESIEEIERFIAEVDSRSRTEYLTTLKLRKMVAAAKGDRLVTVRQHQRRLHDTEIEGQVSL